MKPSEIILIWFFLIYTILWLSLFVSFVTEQFTIKEKIITSVFLVTAISWLFLYFLGK